MRNFDTPSGPPILVPVAVILMIGIFAAAPARGGTSRPVNPAVAQQVLRDLGADYSVYASASFILVHTNDELWAQRTSALLEQTRERFFQAFAEAGFSLRAPQQPLVWVCFNSRNDFDAYALRVDQMDMSWSKGYYSARTNRVAMMQPPRPHDLPVTAHADTRGSTDVYPTSGGEPGIVPWLAVDITNATHEAAHQLAFNSGLQKRGVMYPLWASEGMAVNFESDKLVADGLGGDNAPRRRQLVRAYHAGNLMPLDQFVTLTRLPFGDLHSIHEIYAQSWGFFHFLLTERSDALQQYLHRLATLPSGWRDPKVMRREFTNAFGSVESLERPWQQYLRRLVSDAQASSQ